jgi:thiamine biosynthesis lipoprotein
MDIWGFTSKNYCLPSEEEINKALESVGMEKISFNDSENVVEFKTSGMSIDLGGIAKGYALDSAVRKLKLSGINNCLINAGGQVYALGDNYGKAWKVAIKNPRGKGIADYLEIKNSSVATSGDYEQYFIRDAKRYSHIMNPKTGYPADSGIISVTVISPSALVSDALSTSIFVMGKDKGKALAASFADTQVRIVMEPAD